MAVGYHTRTRRTAPAGEEPHREVWRHRPRVRGQGGGCPIMRRRPGMTDVPIVVGINRTQDGSIAVAAGRSTVFSLQKERISRRKHHWGRLGDLPDRYLPHLPVLRQPVDLVVEG